MALRIAFNGAIRKGLHLVTGTVLNEGESTERRPLDVIQYDGDGS